MTVILWISKEGTRKGVKVGGDCGLAQPPIYIGRVKKGKRELTSASSRKEKPRAERSRESVRVRLPGHETPFRLSTVHWSLSPFMPVVPSDLHRLTGQSFVGVVCRVENCEHCMCMQMLQIYFLPLRTGSHYAALAGLLAM